MNAYRLTSAIIFFAIIKLCSADPVPQVGSFVFTQFEDSSCKIGMSRADYSGAVSCWDLGGGNSLEVEGWFDANSTLIASFQLSNNMCVGNAILNWEYFPCDGTCLPAFTNNQGNYFTCMKTIQPAKGNFEVNKYSDKKCSNKILPIRKFQAFNTCWAASETTSFFPLNYEANSTLILYYFTNDNSCLDYSNYSAEVLACDSTSCVADPESPNTYISCTYYSFSRYLTNSLMLTLGLIIFFIF